MTNKEKALAALLYVSLIKWAESTIDVLERVRATGVHDDMIDDLIHNVNDLIDKKLAEHHDSDDVMDEIEKVNAHIVKMKAVYGV
jgi:hypothetical protein